MRHRFGDEYLFREEVDGLPACGDVYEVGIAGKR
jgi:hypothetical protein